MTDKEKLEKIKKMIIDRTKLVFDGDQYIWDEKTKKKEKVFSSPAETSPHYIYLRMGFEDENEFLTFIIKVDGEDSEFIKKYRLLKKSWVSLILPKSKTYKEYADNYGLSKGVNESGSVNLVSHNYDYGDLIKILGDDVISKKD